MLNEDLYAPGQTQRSRGDSRARNWFYRSYHGAEIQDYARMDAEDVTDTINSLMSAGYVESVPFYEEVQIAEMPVTAFEVNAAYVHELKQALFRR